MLLTDFVDSKVSSRYLWYLPSYRADSYSDCFTTAIQKWVFIRHRIKMGMSSCRCCWLDFSQEISSRYLWYLPNYRADSYSDCFTTAIQKWVFIRHRIKMSMSSCRCCWLLCRQQISSRYLWYLPSYRADSYSDCFTTAIQKCVFIRHRINMCMSSCICCWLVFSQQISSRYLWYLPSYRADSYSDYFTTAIHKWVFIRHRIKMCMSSCRCCWLDFSQEISSRYLWYLPSYRADSYSDCFTTAIQKWVFIRHRIKMVYIIL